MWALIGSAILFIVMGVLIRNPKWHWLISGYNTMSKEKKEKVDIEGLSAFLAKMLFLMAGIFLLSTLAYYLDHPLIFLGIMALMFPQTIYILIKAQKYDGNSKNADGSYKTQVKLLIGFIVLTFIGLGILIYVSMLPVEVVITDEHLEIKGMYGRNVKWEDIEQISLEEEIPKIMSRTNGSSIGDMNKGNFRLKDRGRALLFIVANHPPYIYIERKKGLIIINDKDREVTVDLYNRIIEAYE